MFARIVRTLVATATLASTLAVGSYGAGAAPVPGCERKISVARVSAFEGTPPPRGGSTYTPFVFAVTTTVEHRIGAPGCPVAAASVRAATVHSTTDAADLVAVSQSLSWPAADVSSRTVVVSVRRDSSVECDERFAVRLTGPGRGQPVVASGAGKILDDDHSPFGTSRGWHCSG